MKINQIKSIPTSNKKKKRVGRGAGSGYGKFTGKGKEGNWTKYTPGMRSVANYMVVWNKDGSNAFYDKNKKLIYFRMKKCFSKPLNFCFLNRL